MKQNYSSSFSRIGMIAIFLLAISGVSFGQKASSWEAELPAPIVWQKTTSLGNLIVSTGTALSGIDPATGKISWTLDKIQNASEDNFENISGTPFFSVTDNRNSIFIVEPFEGKILFSSSAAGIERISDKYFLYQSKAILILGYPAGEKTPSMVMVDMSTGQKMWSKSGEFSKISSCYDLGNDEFLVSSLFYVYKLNVKTGDIKWKKCIDARLEKMGPLLDLMDKGAGNSALGNRQFNGALVLTEFAPDMVFMAAQKETQRTMKGADGKETTTTEYSTIYNAFKVSTGDYAWPGIIEINGKMGLLIPDKGGLIITHGTMNMNNSAVNMIDYSNGQKLWGKKGNGLQLKGEPAGSAKVGGKIVISSANGHSSFIYFLDPSTGTMAFDKPEKMDGAIQKIETSGDNLLFVSEEEINLYSTTTGEFTFDKSLRGNKGNIVSGEDKIYIFNQKDDKLYVLEKGTTAANPLTAAPVKFQGKEDPNHIEIRDNGILISSEQNIALVDFNGNLIFNKYYPAPDQENWKKALLIANAVYGAYATAVYSYSSAAFGAVSQTIQVTDNNSKAAKDITGAVSRAYGDAANAGLAFTKNAIAAATKRFKASSENNNSMFMMVEISKKHYGLAQIDKKTGEQKAVIDMAKDKTPSYDLDMVENTVYYKSADRKIQAYKFN